MPIRNNPCHDVVSPAGQVVNPVESNVSYANTPNRAKYLSDIIHKIVSEEKAQEALNTSEAPQVFPDVEKRLQRVLERLVSLSSSCADERFYTGWVADELEDIIRQARGDIDESS